MNLSRRDLLRGGAATVAASLLPPLARPIFAQCAPLDTAFALTERERIVLEAAANRIVPPFTNDRFNDASPNDPPFRGAGTEGAVDYVEQLLQAFHPRSDGSGNPLPPRIYASVRGHGEAPGTVLGSRTDPAFDECHGGHLAVPDGWLELPPEKELGWRAAIGRFQVAYRNGLAQLDADAQQVFSDGFAEIRPILQTALLASWDGTNNLSRLGGVHSAGGGEAALSPAFGSDFGFAGGESCGDDRSYFFNALHTHTIESLYGDPIYGGNRNRIGWKLASFGGPRHPEGYFEAELETRSSCSGGIPFNFGFVESL